MAKRQGEHSSLGDILKDFIFKLLEIRPREYKPREYTQHEFRQKDSGDKK